MRGVEVSRRFYDTDVAPGLDGVPHAAGRVGRGSDALGFDDAMSQDHDWGARVTVITDRPTPPLPDGVELFTFDSFVDAHLGRVPQDDIDWLLLTGQSVLEVTAGPVFRDDVGDGATGDPFGATTAMRFVVYLTIGYMVARGLAKSGSRERYDA